MSDFGVQPTGFLRKPLPRILQEIETDLFDTFGQQLIQTSESPMGQINGIFAASVNDLWELGEEIYQSLDPDQAEGSRLESLARLRLLSRNGLSDIDLRTEINNEGITKFDVKDVEQSLLSVSDYARVVLNDTGTFSNIQSYIFQNSSESLEVPLGNVLVAVTENDNHSHSDVANVLLQTLPIGSQTSGATLIETNSAASVAQSFRVFFVENVDTELELNLRLDNSSGDAFIPDAQQIINGFAQRWQEDRRNGKNVTFYNLRSVIECVYPNLEVVSFRANRFNEPTGTLNDPFEVGFSQFATIPAANVTINIT